MRLTITFYGLARKNIRMVFQYYSTLHHPIVVNGFKKAGLHTTLHGSKHHHARQLFIA
ncbi:hypothetical protein [uncultured Bartonella sp.]|uniref:hypothetical protein n=1 Tax=uncultured Bartonella sp. TaxID=104108 RepID=UPI0025F26A42|nr:hypothetical protein [uncultured Bartonella sp.]